MVRRVRNPPNHNPCPGSRYIKKFRFRLPPGVVFRPQRREPLSAVFRIALHEFQSSLRRRQRRRVDVNSQHADKPQIFTHALMHHLLVHVAPRGSPRAAAPEDLIADSLHTPTTLMRSSRTFQQEFVSHNAHPCARFRGHSLSRKQSRQLMPSIRAQIPLRETSPTDTMPV